MALPRRVAEGVGRADVLTIPIGKLVSLLACGAVIAEISALSTEGVAFDASVGDEVEGVSGWALIGAVAIKQDGW